MNKTFLIDYLKVSENQHYVKLKSIVLMKFYFKEEYGDMNEK